LGCCGAYLGHWAPRLMWHCCGGRKGVFMMWALIWEVGGGKNWT
jgi:hypothetical protein